MNKRFFIALCALFSFVFYANAVKVVFRLDDPTIQFDSVHSRVLKLFIEKEVPLSIALIPCTKAENLYELNDSIYWELLNAFNIEIALHGLTHEDINGRGEFGGISSEETNRRFQKGKRIVEQSFGKTINTFIPPFNATNASFPENMMKNSLLILSADMFQHVPCEGNIQYYPETLGHLMKQKSIWNAAKESLITCKEKHAICVIMFHAYDLPDSSAWQQLENLLDLCKNEDEIELYTFCSLYLSGERSSWLRYRANQLTSGLSKLLLMKGVLHPTWLCLLVHTINALIYMLISIIGLIFLLARTSSTKSRRSISVFLLIICVIMFYSAWFHLLSPLKLLLIAFLFSIIPLLFLIKNRKFSINTPYS